MQLTKKLLAKSSVSILGLALILAQGVASGGRAIASTAWKMPWSSSIKPKVTQTWHSDGYGRPAIDVGLSAGTPVLAPIDSKVVSQCDAGNNHRAILLEASNGQRYSLIHVTTNNIAVGKTYKQGDQIGVVASDKPNNKCAVSTGPHLHFGLPSSVFSIDGYNFNSSTPAYGTALGSTNGSVIDNTIAVNFSGKTAPGGANVRSGPGLNFPVVRTLGGNQTVAFDGWKFGTAPISDIWTGQPDYRWYRIAGTNQWVASAVIWGNAPGSRPIP